MEFSHCAENSGSGTEALPVGLGRSSVHNPISPPCPEHKQPLTMAHCAISHLTQEGLHPLPFTRVPKFVLGEGQGAVPEVELVFQGVRLQMSRGRRKRLRDASLLNRKPAIYRGFFDKHNSFFFFFSSE